MKLNILNYFLAITITFSIGSCGIVSLDENADGVNNIQSITVTNDFPTEASTLNTALTNNSSKSWNVTGFTLAGGSTFQSCRLDDTITLNDDGSYSYDGGGSLCGAEDNTRIRSGAWEVDFSSRTLYFDKETDREIEAFIETCEGSQIIISTQYFGMSILGRLEI